MNNIKFETLSKSNKYISVNTDSGFIRTCHEINDTIDLTLIHGLQDYPDCTWTSEVDLFETLDPDQLTRLQQHTDTFFVFNSELEGWNDLIFIEVLYNNCKKYNIPASKVIFVSANMDIEQRVLYFNQKYRIQESIKSFPFLSFKIAVGQGFIWDPTNFELVEKSDNELLQYHKNCVNDCYTDKYFLSLSRRTRTHRNLLHFIMSSSVTIEKRGKISQNVLDEQHISELTRLFPTHSIIGWNNTLPRIADTPDFQTNHANKLNKTLQWSTLFQVVGETYGDLDNKSGMFFSEKTFKPVAVLQPFIIAGQHNCNKRLEEYGFKLYRNLFDYSFDSIQHTPTRYKAICKELIRVIRFLDTLSREEQIEWRFQESETLLHNYKLLCNFDTEINNILNFLKKL